MSHSKGRRSKGSQSDQKTSIKPYLVAVARVDVAEPLDVVEDEPGQGDCHEDDEGDGDKHHGRSAHILLQVPRPHCDVHHDYDFLLQQRHDVLPLGLRDHHSDYVSSAWGGSNAPRRHM